MRRLSLRARLVLGVLALATVGLVAADIATYTSLRSFLFDRTDSSLESAHRGERRAQLVRRIRDEPPQLALRRFARAERRLDLAEHRIQRQAEPADLGALLRALHAP